MLIYNHLPYDLKPSFLYMVAFANCCECDIQDSKIIKLWIAEGFVKQTAYQLWKIWKVHTLVCGEKFVWSKIQILQLYCNWNSTNSLKKCCQGT